MKTLIPADTRKPVAGFANYSANIDDPDPHKPMGPNLLGEALWPVTVERSESSTRVGFAYTAPLDGTP